MHEVQLQTVVQQIHQAVLEDNLELAERILWPALDQFPWLPQLWTHAGHIFYKTERYLPAITCFEKSLNLEPNAAVMANMGACLRRVNRIEEARRILEKSVDYDRESAPAWSNLAATYVNEGEPDKGVELCNRALEKDPTHQQAGWNRALMNLERGHFADGFKSYRIGLGDKRLEKDYGPSCVWLTAENFEEAKGQTVIVYGEQGIGDELMYASCLFDMANDFEIIYDCHPRLVDIFRANLPSNITLHPTRKVKQVDWYDGEPYKISMADVPAFYRTSRRKFRTAWKKHGPFYDNPVMPMEMESYRVGLEAAAEGRKIVGLATRGGVMSTNRTYRQIRPEALDRLLGDPDLMFVSLDYEHVDAQCEEINQKYGEGTIYNFPAITHHFDYNHTHALVLACDAVVTVCQSVAHLSAASGQDTLVLTPRKAAWRYGLKGKQWFWYPGDNIKLFRQETDDWNQPIERLWQHLTAKIKGGSNV